MVDQVPEGAIAEEEFPVTSENFHAPQALPNPDVGGTLFERIHAATVGNLPVDSVESESIIPPVQQQSGSIPVPPPNSIVENAESEENYPATEDEERGPIEEIKDVPVPDAENADIMSPEEKENLLQVIPTSNDTEDTLDQKRAMLKRMQGLAEGGEVVPPGAIPEEEFEGSQDQVPEDAIPVDDFYGTGTQMAKTAIEQGLAGATLGASKVFETKILGVKPEDIAAREEENPITSFLAGTVGTGALLGATGGLGGLAGEGASLSARIGIGALEGAGIGGANQITDDWSQNKALDAQKIAASAGLGAIIGTAGAGIVEGIKSKFFPRITPEEPTPFISSELGTLAQPGNPMGEAPSSLKPPVSSLEEAEARLQKARLNGLNIDRPQAAIGLQALSQLDLGDFNPPAMQIEAIANPDQANRWNLAKELSGKTGDTVRGFESGQKQEIVSQIDQQINDLSPNQTPTNDKLEGGNRTNQILTDRYNQIRDATIPALNQLKKLDIDRADHLVPVVNAITSGVNNPLAAMFEISPERSAQQIFLGRNGIPIVGGGELHVVPFSDSMHIEKTTYDSVKRLVGNLKDGDTSLEDLMHYRNVMGNSIESNTEGGRTSISEIGTLKAKMMDYIQGYVQSFDPELQVREPLKAWAVNEAYRGAIEDMAGSVGKTELGVKSKIIPEKVNDNIFRDSSSVQTVKNFLGSDEKFNEILSNHLAEKKNSATKLGVFSTANFARYLDSNTPQLKTAFGQNPSLAKLNALTAAARIFPDNPSVNPSHTARTLLAAIQEFSLYPPDMFKELGKHAYEFFKQRSELRAFNAELSANIAGKSARVRASLGLQDAVNKITKNVDSGVKSLFVGSSSQARKAQ